MFGLVSAILRRRQSRYSKLKRDSLLLSSFSQLTYYYLTKKHLIDQSSTAPQVLLVVANVQAPPCP